MLTDHIAKLRSLTPQHLQLGHKMLSAHDGDIYPMDFLGAAVLNRSIRLINGFSDLIGNNFISAAPLVRLQLDNLLRFHAAFLVTDPHGFAMDVLRGNQINRLTGHDGGKLSDSYLVKKLGTKYPEIKDVYEKGCSYVHLSDVHLLHALQSCGDKKIAITISLEDSECTDDMRQNAVKTMTHVTHCILTHVEGWVHTKAHPELVQEPLKRARLLRGNGKNDEAKALLETIVANHLDSATINEAKQLLAQF